MNQPQNKPNAHSDQDAVWLLYDEDCPFCSRYVRLIRLKKSVGDLLLVNARHPSPYRDEVQNAGLDINDGMTLKYGQQLYHGDACIHMLALLSTRLNAVNKLNAWLFKSPARAKLLYPLLRAGRKFLLWLLGRKMIDTTVKNGDTKFL